MIFGLYHSIGETIGLIGDVIKGLHLPFKAIHLYEGDGLPRDTSDLEGLIIMGGPMNADEVATYPFLLPETQLIEKVILSGKPVLGICLGAQLMAKALGQRVFANRSKEVGWHPIQLTPAGAVDPVFGLLPKEVDVLHWHGDTFDLPEGAVHLASSGKCANQAFRWGDNSYALQFHFEVTPTMLAGWCGAKSEAPFIAAAGETPLHILESTPKAFSKIEPHALNFFRTYLKTAYSRLLTTA